MLTMLIKHTYASKMHLLWWFLVETKRERIQNILKFYAEIVDDVR